MLELGRFIGRQKAHDIVYRICMEVVESAGSFREALHNDPEVRAHLALEQIEALLKPETYLGLAPIYVDRVAGTHTSQQEVVNP